MSKHASTDNEDLEVEIDDEDIKNNIKESKKPIEPEMQDDQDIQDDDETEQIQNQINKIETEDNIHDDKCEKKRIYVQQQVQWTRYYGNYYTFLDLNDEPYFAVSHQALKNIIVILFFTYQNYQLVQIKQGNLHLTITIVLCLLEFLGYLLCAILNPGICTAQNQISNINLTCQICLITHHTNTIYHCLKCNVCIKGYHHHSWVYGKCIGEGNKFYYFLTLILFPIYLANMIILTYI